MTMSSINSGEPQWGVSEMVNTDSRDANGRTKEVNDISSCSNYSEARINKNSNNTVVG